MTTTNNGPLTMVDANDLDLASSYRSTSPMEISAVDGNGQSLLYITGDSGRALKISIKNVSNIGYSLPKMSGKVSPTCYHLAIRFRPGTLSKQSDTAPPIPRGVWSSVLVTEKSGVQVIYVLFKDGLDFATVKEHEFTFSSISAGSTMGAHSTKVEFSYANLTPPSGSPISGTVSQVMQVINAEGVDASPFYFGVAGSNMILNNGTSNSMSFFIGTAGNHEVNIAENSEMILSFTTGTISDKPWAIATANELSMIQGNDINISADANGVWKCVGSKAEGDTYDFQITFKKATTLSPGSPVLLTLTGLKTSHPNGLTPVVLRYMNIQGYWDRSIYTWLSKGPVVIGHDSQGNVGIGKIPEATLDVNGEIHTKGISSGAVTDEEATTDPMLLGGFLSDDNTQWPAIRWVPYAENTWDEGILKMGKDGAHFGHGGFGFHTMGFEQDNVNYRREVGFYTSGFTPMLICEGETGNTYIKGKLGVGVPRTEPNENTKSFINVPFPNSPEIQKGIHIGDSQDSMENINVGLLISIPSVRNDLDLAIHVERSNGDPVFSVDVHGEISTPNYRITNEMLEALQLLAKGQLEVMIQSGDKYLISDPPGGVNAKFGPQSGEAVMTIRPTNLSDRDVKVN